MRLLSILVTTGVLVVLGGCGGTDDAADGSITVFAAASLTDAFDEVADAFEAADPDVDVSVDVSFAGSSSLREQVLEGAPADVFASANVPNMDAVVEAGAAGSPRVFATNRLQIVVPAGNPAGIDGLDDFADDELLVGLCAAEVPCGDFARQALDRAGVRPAPDTNEPDVRALLTKVEAGELDAGIVYVTDVASAGDRVEGIDIPDEHNVVATYPIATLTGSGDPEAAAAFVAFVLGDGQDVLAEFGFGRP
ncbi:MAG: molybdate ABC transporter substrate-binding protein [Acidimicrobiales bacterium]|nr:molybdate ABC transporter substrate-binding protein [Acidimicrobiales bacterium]